MTQPSAKYIHLTANFIRHMVTWRWRWARDQNTVIGRWKVICSRISVHTVGLLAYTDWLLELSCSPMTFSVWDLGTGPINEMILFCHVIRYGWRCWFLLPNLSGLPVSMFCCWWIPLLFCAPLVSLHNSGLFLQCTYCCSYGMESCKHTHLSGQLYVYPWDGLEDSLTSCRVLRLCLFSIFDLW